MSELYGDTFFEQVQCESIVEFCEDELGGYPSTEEVSATWYGYAGFHSQFGDRKLQTRDSRGDCTILSSVAERKLLCS